MQHQQHLQINVGHLKTEMVRKLGAERSKLYFFYLNRFLSLKITRIEFNKICFRVLGRESIVLHNQLITSILRNAYHAKAPPDSADESGDCTIPAPSDELQQTSTCKDQAHTFNSSLLPNGSILQPPFIARSGSHERPKADILSSHSKDIADQSYISVLENGSEVVLQDSNRFAVIPVSEDEQSRVCNDSKISSAEDWTGVTIRRHLQAPLGVPLPAVSTHGTRMDVALESNGGCVSSYDCGGLLDSVTLKYCMEQIAMNEGLQGVSLDSANLLNNALDSYLKSLIRSSIEMAGKGSGCDTHLDMTYKSPLQNSFGIRLLSSNQPQILQEQRPVNKVSLLDFRVAMELRPQQLGEDWPLLLQKMCAHSHRD